MTEIDRRLFVVTAGAGAAVACAAVGGLVAGLPERGAVSHGRGLWTRFGSVDLLGASRQRNGGSVVHQHGPVDRRPTGHRSWPDKVRIQVEVQNGSDRPVLVSPGQFRLQVGHRGPTVTHYAADWTVGPLAAGDTLVGQVTYLAPASGGLWVEFDEPGASSPRLFTLEKVRAS